MLAEHENGVEVNIAEAVAREEAPVIAEGAQEQLGEQLNENRVTNIPNWYNPLAGLSYKESFAANLEVDNPTKLGLLTHALNTEMSEESFNELHRLLSAQFFDVTEIFENAGKALREARQQKSPMLPKQFTFTEVLQSGTKVVGIDPVQLLLAEFLHPVRSLKIRNITPQQPPNGIISNIEEADIVHGSPFFSKDDWKHPTSGMSYHYRDFIFYQTEDMQLPQVGCIHGFYKTHDDKTLLSIVQYVEASLLDWLPMPGDSELCETMTLKRDVPFEAVLKPAQVLTPAVILI